MINKQDKTIDWQSRIFTGLTLILVIATYAANYQVAKIFAGFAASVCVLYTVGYIVRGELLSAILPVCYVAWGLHSVFVPVEPERTVMSSGEVVLAYEQCKAQGLSFVPEYDKNDPAVIYAVRCSPKVVR